MNFREELDIPVPTIVLAEGEFGTTNGKTANGVVMHSEIFDARVVVDSTTAGRSPSEVLGKDSAPSIPIVASVREAIEATPDAEALVIGVAPAGGQLPESWVPEIELAIESGCDIVSGLHTFLGDQQKWRSRADANDVRIFDVRKPPADGTLRVADGSVDDVDADIVLTLGTDCAVGKRTTTFELYKATREAGLDAGWVATGQTGVMIGAHAGVAIDRVPADFTAGVVEDLVTEVGADHDIVFVEGQAALTHRAYSGVTLSILHGACPDTVLLADDPSREQRINFERFTTESVARERQLIQDLSAATVAGLSTWGDAATEEDRTQLPTANIYDPNGRDELLEIVLTALSDDSG